MSNMFLVCLLGVAPFLPAIIGYTLVHDGYTPLYGLAGWLTLEDLTTVFVRSFLLGLLGHCVSYPFA